MVRTRSWHFEVSSTRSGQNYLLFAIILTIGYIISILNIMKNMDNKNDNDILNTLRTKNVISSFLFSLFGLIAWISITCDSKKILLCDGDIVLLLILVNIVVYNIINYLKLHGLGWLWASNSASNTETNINYDFEVLIILCIWQLYIYFLVDGFRSTSIANLKESITTNVGFMFTMLSMFVIFTLLIYTFVSSAACQKWKYTKHINNLREISYNMFITAFISIIIIYISINKVK